MYLDEIIEKLMNLDEQTVPCELGIPCPYYNPQADGTYCHRGSCEGWKDWDDGSDEVQVVIDGTTYYTHFSNVVLIAH